MAFVAEAAHRATDAEWAHVEPLIPPARCGGNRRHVDVRQVVNGLMYVLSTGLPWRAVPKELPPRSTLYDYFDLWFLRLASIPHAANTLQSHMKFPDIILNTGFFQAIDFAGNLAKFGATWHFRLRKSNICAFTLAFAPF